MVYWNFFAAAAAVVVVIVVDNDIKAPSFVLHALHVSLDTL